VIVNAVQTAGLRLGMWGAGLGALGRLTGAGLAAARAPGGFTANAAALLGDPARQAQATAVLRAFVPNLRLNRELVAAYDNSGTVIVTRHADVMDVLRRDADFEVVYGPRMRQLTAGANFFLGMQPTPPPCGWRCATRTCRRAWPRAQQALPRRRWMARAGGSTCRRT